MDQAVDGIMQGAGCGVRCDEAAWGGVAKDGGEHVHVHVRILNGKEIRYVSVYGGRFVYLILYIPYLSFRH